MRIFLNVPIHTHSKRYTKDPNECVQHSTIVNIIFSNNSIYDEIRHRIKALTVDTLTLPKPMKVYFDGCCKYPRYKLKDNPDYKRVIKQSNSDIVIYTSVENKIHHNGYIYNRLFLINDEIYSIDPELLKNKTCHEFLNLKDDIIVEELIYTTSKYVTTDVAQSLYNLFNVYTKIISDKQLDTMINSTLMNMTDEDYSSIKEMLKSQDDETFKLGLKMLINYNTNSNACRIGTLLRENCTNRAYQLNDVNTKQILSTLEITNKDLQYTDTHKHYIKSLLKISTNDDDKAFAREFIIQNAYKYIKERASAYIDGFAEMDIQMDLKLY